jgi:hypothetical protein
LAAVQDWRSLAASNIPFAVRRFITPKCNSRPRITDGSKTRREYRRVRSRFGSSADVDAPLNDVNVHIDSGHIPAVRPGRLVPSTATQVQTLKKLSTTSSINLPMLRKRRHQRLHCECIQGHRSQQISPSGVSAVTSRRECVAQCWPPVPPRGHCACRKEVFVNPPPCFSTDQ